jgi:hypothetical protein
MNDEGLYGDRQADVNSRREYQEPTQGLLFRSAREDEATARAKRRKHQMKFGIFSATVAFAMAAGAPATARDMVAAQSIYCATREAGNPYSKYCDYIAWNGWRRRGAWDSTLDNACLRDPRYVPYDCWR